MKKRAPARVRVSTGDRRRSGGQTRSGYDLFNPSSPNNRYIKDVSASRRFEAGRNFFAILESSLPSNGEYKIRYGPRGQMFQCAGALRKE
jgi:hypothetical protein